MGVKSSWLCYASRNLSVQSEAGDMTRGRRRNNRKTVVRSEDTTHLSPESRGLVGR